MLCCVLCDKRTGLALTFDHNRRDMVLTFPVLVADLTECACYSSTIVVPIYKCTWDTSVLYVSEAKKCRFYLLQSRDFLHGFTTDAIVELAVLPSCPEL